MKFDSLKTLRSLISIPSPSRCEDGTADFIVSVLEAQNIAVDRFRNCVWAVQPGFDNKKPTLMLNSHHDTVKPVGGYTRNPYEATVDGDKVYGLGSNDAGASVVSLMSLFVDFYKADLPFNLLLALTAEEEVMGADGMRGFLPYLSQQGIVPDMALVGEPTDMQPAVGERGIVVLDCVAHGRSGHAARKDGLNALYEAMSDIATLRSMSFPRESALLGPVGIEVTMIKCGTQHNVIPDRCEFTVDVRTTDAYSNEETVEMIRQSIKADATPRSTRVHASAISEEHPMVKAAIEVGRVPFVSPTTSDMALMHGIPSLKMGPGQSRRSHSANEFVLISEIEDAQRIYKEYIHALGRIMTKG